MESEQTDTGSPSAEALGENSGDKGEEVVAAATEEGTEKEAEMAEPPTEKPDKDEDKDTGKDKDKEIEKDVENIDDANEDVEKDKDDDTEKEGENTEANEGEEASEKEDMPMSSFIDEDSASRSSLNSRNLRDDDNNGLKTEDQNSVDCGSIQSEVQMSVEPDVVMNEDNDSRLSGNKEANGNEGPGQDLLADETLAENSNDGEGEDIVTEVDISSMMEVNLDEDSNAQPPSQDEPEVISLHSDDDDDAEASKKSDKDGTANGVEQRVYQIDDDENISEVDVSSMMQVDMDETSQSSTTSSVSRRPRRAAAEAAAKTIHEISAAEEDVSERVFRHRRKSQEDNEFDPVQEIGSNVSSPSTGKQQKCHVCKKEAHCGIVIRQYGADIHLCSNSCFDRFRNQGRDSKNKSLPCAKCSLMDGEGHNTAFYWETMNFCTDLCVGRYQMDVGSKCCTCGQNVSWTSLGKYCVRFGSDIRQFCTPQCLEGYKRNARVCFNCQLDIRRIGNIVLANIPSKNTPKEFCSNDCVEMYCERNMHQPTRTKPPRVLTCSSCHVSRPVFRELVLLNGTFRSCSDTCWRSLLRVKGISKSEKCEMCSKFVNMDLGFTTPVYWLSTAARIFGFCSHVCKNLYILSSRKILSCVSCKVKKYNYDLIEFFTNNSSNYAVCSLACLPKPGSYLKKIRDVIFIPQPTSDKSSLSAVTLNDQSVPVISAVSGSKESNERPPRQRRRQPQTNLSSSNKVAEVIEIDDDDDDDSDDEDLSQIVMKDSDNIMDIFTIEEIMNLMKLLKREQASKRDVACYTRPKTKTVETQTDVSELNQLRLIPYLGGGDKESSEKDGESTGSKKDGGEDSIKAVEESQGKENEGSKNDDLGAKMDDDEATSKTGDDPKDKDGGQEDSVPVSSTAKESVSGSSKSAPEEPLSSEKCSEHDDSALHEKEPPVPSSSTTIPMEVDNEPDKEEQPRSDPEPVRTQVEPQQRKEPEPVIERAPGSQSNPAEPLPPPTGSNSTSSSHAHPTTPSAVPTTSIPPSPIPPIHQPSPGPYQSPYASAPVAPAASQPPSSPSGPRPPGSPMVDYALRTWKNMFGPASDPVYLSSMELSSKLCELIRRGCKPNGERFRADMLLYISLGIQQILRDNKRADKIFYDQAYYSFVIVLTEYTERELAVGIHATIEENHFYDASELGASSPGVLLFTLIYMFQKHFGLKTWEQQASLQFSHIVVQSRYDQYGRYIKYISLPGLPGSYPTEVPEDVTRPDRCLVKLYEFYCYKSENPQGPFYKCLRYDYTPRTPWFTCQPLDQQHIYQMLVRASMIKIENGYS